MANLNIAPKKSIKIKKNNLQNCMICLQYRQLDLICEEYIFIRLNLFTNKTTQQIILKVAISKIMYLKKNQQQQHTYIYSLSISCMMK